MKAPGIVWNIVLVALALYGGLVRWGPAVCDQAHFQFTDRRGGSSMWPATFEMTLSLAAIFACLVVLSYFFNRKLGVLARIIAGALAVLLLLAWFASGVLWIRYDYPGSLYIHLAGFDGLGFMAVAVVGFGLTAVTGRGPITLGAEFLRRITGKKNVDASDAVARQP